MKEQFTIFIFTERKISLFHRLGSVFGRRLVHIESITNFESNDIQRYTVVICEEETRVINLVKQLEKQIDIFKAFYHRNEELVYQEIALYKVPIDPASSAKAIEKIIRLNYARILTVEPGFIIIEKTGFMEEIQELCNSLAPYGLMDFVRSGRVAIARPVKNIKMAFCQPSVSQVQGLPKTANQS